MKIKNEIEITVNMHILYMYIYIYIYIYICMYNLLLNHYNIITAYKHAQLLIPIYIIFCMI